MNLRPLWLALGFLTVFPVPQITDVRAGEMRAASAFYPVAGYAVGAVLALLAWLTAPLPDGLQAALLLAAWLACTGMLHLDGLLDSADALLSVRSVERRLEILSDVHVGSFAFGAGFVHLLLKWQLLVALVGAGAPPLVFLAIPALVRFALLLPMNLFPAARREGLGAVSREGRILPAALLALPAIAFLPWAALAVVAAMLLLARWAAGRLGGGISGDVYGMLVELGESAGLLAALWLL